MAWGFYTRSSIAHGRVFHPCTIGDPRGRLFVRATSHPCNNGDAIFSRHPKNTMADARQHRYSAAELAQRRAACPKPEYPEELPVSARREDIGRAIAQHQVVIVCGETGSGKTT